MTNRFLAVLLSTLLASCSSKIPLQVPPHVACDYDRARLLALDEKQFDQDMSGGWRALASQPGCNLAAADLLRDYRQLHGNEAGLLYWHEGQLRALAGQYEAAIALMERSRKPASADLGDWNPYVDATVAFLRKDRLALDRARLRLAAFQPPPGSDLPPVRNGFMEVPFGDNGELKKIPWPPNIDVVDGLRQCFDKPYDIAYSNECRIRSD